MWLLMELADGFLMELNKCLSAMLPINFLGTFIVVREGELMAEK